jgi:threonine dehydratase
MIEPTLDPAEVRHAAGRIAPFAHRTPVLTSATLDRLTGGSIFLKCENFQRVGAFKFRGAMNAVLQLTDEQKRAGVVTHSSGNHAQALALAGKLAGVPVVVVMPRTAPAVKKAATEGYGASVVPCEPTVADREATVAGLIAEHGYTLVHPYDDPRVIAGAGTAALELLDEAGPLDALVCPVGGGGLASGTCLAAQLADPAPQVFAAEPANADDARRSMEQNVIVPSVDPRTCCDGLRTSLGKLNFSILRRHVAGVPTATEPEILDAMRLVWERMKIIVEPSCVVPVATLLNGQIPTVGRRIGVILTGGNVDLDPMFRSLASDWL